MQHTKSKEKKAVKVRTSVIRSIPWMSACQNELSFQAVPRAHPASCTMGTDTPGGKAAGAWRWLPTPT